MKVQPQSLAGVHLLVPQRLSDERGFFARIFDRDLFRAAGLVTDFPQWSVSFNQRRDTIRGLHWQAQPHSEAKLVQCMRGAIFDVVVDIRAGSPTCGCWLGFELTEDNCHALYIPPGFAHGYLTQMDGCELLYHISCPYVAGAARGLRWNDPHIGIKWPSSAEPILSSRDAALPLFDESLCEPR